VSKITTFWRHITGVEQKEALEALVSQGEGTDPGVVESLIDRDRKTREMIGALTRRIRELEARREEDRNIIEQLVASNNGLVAELAAVREARNAFESELKTTFEGFEEIPPTEVLPSKKKV
jgi:uncharacterized coiled-coil DUF342 family protein